MSRRARLMVLGAGVLIGAVIASALGAVEISALDLGALWLERLGVIEASESIHHVQRSVFWFVRAPRVLMASLIGASLGLSGAALQGIFRNPLADPGLIGVSSGAALGAVCVILLGSALSIASSMWVLPIAAFAGALIATACVLRLATRAGRVDVATMLLCGIAINALAGSLIGFATYVSDDAQLRSLTMWSLGSLGASSWTQCMVVALTTVSMGWALCRRARALDLLLLGEREASHLGLDVTRARREVVWMSALVAGAGVGFTGIIGFVGLVVPHIVRSWGGASHRWVLPASALGGALLLTLADTLARTVAAPAELPIGVITSLVGAPFFLAMLMQQRVRTRGLA